MRHRALLLVAVLWSAACVASAAPPTGPSEVRIVETPEGYRLTVDGDPFYVKGAGLQAGDQEALAARGANALRTWHTGDDHAAVVAMLDRAQRNGLRVAMGLDVGKERHGFDYDDRAAVAAQLARLRAQAALYKDHPAVLMWVVGNELNLEYRNPRVWDAVEDITTMLHAIDPHHPVMTPLAGFDAAVVREIKARAPSLDLLGIQMYGDLGTLPVKLRAADWTGPYLVTEWGPTGHWESPETAWGAQIEDDASRKAALLAERYTGVIEADRRQGLGSFVFLWGQKQERTPTWYGLFLSSGESTPGVDAMQRLWTGAWPANRAPSITPIQLDGRAAVDSVTLAPGGRHSARVRASDPDGDALAYRWRVREESTATSIGGDPETVPPEVPVQADAGDDGTLAFDAPATPGHYRLFVEVRDGHDHAAYANFPFRVAADRAVESEGDTPAAP
ncbi:MULTISPECIES: glycoside hydrolase family 2 TIM barrel-domain containing protein [Luteimonas]|uniref:glycoside hydrolase family 2 TIM barrel-domain containing protein n=1 Tax=Luteimonas TaxID=83614 RepID=UPI000C7A42A3|nr:MULTISPECIES: glycoside hydrolase family 2 TIM barrel-domain containing protein [Luteimonas]